MFFVEMLYFQNKKYLVKSDLKKMFAIPFNI